MSGNCSLLRDSVSRVAAPTQKGERPALPSCGFHAAQHPYCSIRLVGPTDPEDAASGDATFG